MGTVKMGGDPKSLWSWHYEDKPEEVFLLDWGKLMTFPEALRCFNEMPRKAGVKAVLCEMSVTMNKRYVK